MSSAGGSQIDTWLKEGLRLFGQGHNALALEQWYRVLDIDPTNARALDYITLVREHFQADMAQRDAVPEATPGDRPLPQTSQAPAMTGGLVASAPVEERVSVTRTRYATYEDPAPEPQEPAATADNPWDLLDSAAPALDLDRQPPAPSVFDLLLAGASGDPATATRDPEPDLGPAPVVDGGDTTDVTDAIDAMDVTDLVPITGSLEVGAEPPSECDALMEGARELFALGDFSGSLELVEKVLSLEPDNAEARAYLSRNEATLLRMYESKLGNLQRAPRLTTSPDEVIWMNLHHRAGFLLSQIDGELTYEDLAAVSGMSRLETFRILAELVQNGVIA